MIESNDYTENHGRRGFIALPAHMNGGRTGKELPRLDFELLEMNHNERGQRQSDCPGKRTRKDSAFDNHRIQIQQLCKCKFYIGGLRRSIPKPLSGHPILNTTMCYVLHYVQHSFVQSPTAKERQRSGKHRN